MSNSQPKENKNLIHKVNHKVKKAKQVYKYRKELRYLPKVEPPHNLTCFILNIILPGFGTILAAIICKDPKNFTCFNLFFGVLQFLTSFLIIGWIVSIIWGYAIWKRGKHKNVPSNFFIFLSKF
jgi:hypothetical protein